MIQSFLHMINLTAVLPAVRSLVSHVSVKLFELKVLEITFLKTSNLLLTEVSNSSKSYLFDVAFRKPLPAVNAKKAGVNELDLHIHESRVLEMVRPLFGD